MDINNEGGGTSKQLVQRNLKGEVSLQGSYVVRSGEGRCTVLLLQLMQINYS